MGRRWIQRGVLRPADRGRFGGRGVEWAKRGTAVEKGGFYSSIKSDSAAIKIKLLTWRTVCHRALIECRVGFVEHFIRAQSICPSVICNCRSLAHGTARQRTVEPQRQSASVVLSVLSEHRNNSFSESRTRMQHKHFNINCPPPPELPLSNEADCPKRQTKTFPRVVPSSSLLIPLGTDNSEATLTF